MEKGNLVKSNDHDTEGMILAITRDGKRAKVKVFGKDEPVWKSLDSMTVIVSGNETCWKCGGSGIFQGGGGTVNGKFTGYTGDCFACSGKGTQNNEDRLRNHYYWNRAEVIDVAVAEAERGEFESLERTAENMAERGSKGTIDATGYKPPKVKIRSKSTKKNHPDPERKDLGKPKIKSKPKRKTVSNDDSTLIDCKGCGTLHREDTMCPW